MKQTALTWLRTGCCKCVPETNLNGGKPADFSDVCAHYLGPVGKWAAVICSLLALIGAMFAYWILMTNFLYNDIAFVVGSSTITYTLLYFIVYNAPSLAKPLNQI